jgi:hypothetical protein
MDAKDEKVRILPTDVLVQAPRLQKPQRWVLGLVALFASVFVVALRYADLHGGPFSSVMRSSHREKTDLCPQANALYPSQHAQLWESLGREFDGDEFRTRAVNWLAGAIRIPYVSTIAFCDVAFFFLRILCWIKHGDIRRHGPRGRR